MSGSIEVPMRQGRLVRLEPLSRTHAADLAIAAEEDRSSYGFTWVPRKGKIGAYLDSHLERAGHSRSRLAPISEDLATAAILAVHL